MGRKLTIEEMQEIAKERKGKCLSKRYVQTHTKLTWECSNGHRWKATPANIKQGNWCRECSRLKNKYSIEDMQKIAEEKGGKCISKKYSNMLSKLEWECHLGHRWKSRASHIKTGHWCPHCHTYLNEEKCRLIFETIFKSEFCKKRPAWLLNEYGVRMELDGYHEKLQVAFEYQGKQHFKKIIYK